uniref:Suppressor of cytokine signaling 1b n=1 Tax=Poecilia reticulata TaxID=8081 RepID=A0A3P9MT81_POERE
MVRDSLDRTSDQNQKPEPAAEPQSPRQNPEESDRPEPTAEKLNTENKDPAGSKLDFLLWCKLKLEEEPESWRTIITGQNRSRLNIRIFCSILEVFKTINSLYWWTSLSSSRLICADGQPHVFFTLSYQSEDGPTSVRVQLNNLLFSLHGSQKTFPSLFALLAFYTSSPCRLTEPYRRQRPERLNQMCRRALVRTYGAESICTSPGLSPDVKAYVSAYPYCT